MKKWTTLLLMLLLSSSLIANEAPPPVNTDVATPPEITTPTWAVDPIGPPNSKKEPSPEMMKNKHTAAVMIGTAAAVIIGLLVSLSMK